MNQRNPKVLVIICNSQEWLRSRFFWSFMAAIFQSPYLVNVYRAGHPWDVVRNNWGIKAFLESNCDIMVKMDADQEYPANYFRVMVPLVEQYKVIGPLIYDRHPQNDFMPLCFSDKDNILNSKINAHNRTGISHYPYTHTNNFYAREVFQNIKPPWYEARLHPTGLERDNHVDFDVLDKIREVGYKIFTNHDVVVNHLYTQGVDKKFYDTWNNGHKEVL